jgi:phosphoserine phosphatase
MAGEVLYFVRHGETRWNAEFRCQGLADIPLNERGREQAGKTAAELFAVKFDHIFTSPLSRAADFAGAIAGGRDIAPVAIGWLTEVDHGELEGMNREEGEVHHPGMMYDWSERPHTVRFPGGESLEDVERRVALGLVDCLKSHRGKIAFVTHQVVTAVARCILQGRPLSEIWNDKLENGKYLILEMGGEYAARLDEAAKRHSKKEAVK